MPRIGLLSDSHGREAVTRQAVRLLIREGAQLLLHLGDVGSIQVIDALVEVDPRTRQPIPARLVFGNTDDEAVSLARYARDLGVGVDHPVGRIDWNGKSLVFLHGDDEAALLQALAQKVTYLCHGHTHVAADVRRGSTRLINPGALFRAARFSVALLDTDADRLTFYPVVKG